MKTHEKIQQAVIKAACTREIKKKAMRYSYGFLQHPGGESDLVIVNEQATAVYIVPRAYCFIDPLYVFKNQDGMHVRNILAGAEEANALELTNKMYEIDNIVVRIFKNKEGEEIHLNTKLLKTFSPTKEYTYMGTTKCGLVYVYDECQDLIGCICPNRYWEKG